VIVVNSATAGSEETKALVEDLINKYEVGVIAVNVASLSNSDIDKILHEALNEFDIAKLDIKIPSWITVLDDRHPVKAEVNATIADVTGEFRKFKHVQLIREKLAECELFEKVDIASLDSGSGEVEIEISCSDDLYNRIVAEIIGDAINDRGKFIELLQDATLARREYENYKGALEAVKATGYGIAIPQIENMSLETPEVIKQGSRYGIRLRAVAPSIHMIKVEVASAFEPIIGTEEQSKKLLDKLLSDYESNPEKIWESEIFGRKLSEVVNDGIKAKIYLMPENVQYKLRECLEKIVNKGRGGILAFIL
jgi:stage IV sporulation protein A